MDGFRRQNFTRFASDRSTLEERKDFFRQLGLPRSDVYEYAMRSFQAPAFDLDYFEYRRSKLRRQNLSEHEINREVLYEVYTVLREASTNYNSSPMSMYNQSFSSSSCFYDQSSSWPRNTDNYQNNSVKHYQHWQKDSSILSSNRRRRLQQPSSSREWNAPSAGFNNSNVLAQASGIVMQTLQNMSRPNELHTSKNAAEHEITDNPFQLQRIRAFKHQFKKFDKYALLTKNIPPKTYCNLNNSVKAFLLRQQKLHPNDESSSQAHPSAAKRQKTDDEVNTNDDNDLENNMKEHQEDEKEYNNSLQQEKTLSTAEEFLKPHKYGDSMELVHKNCLIIKDEYIDWFKKVKWIQDHLKIEDDDPSLKKTFFFYMKASKEVNNEKIENCFQTIENALEIKDEKLLYQQSYKLLKGIAIYNEFLYVLKKDYLTEQGFQTLEKIYEILLNVDHITYYKGIVKMWIETYSKAANEPESKALLKDKAFNWLVRLAVKEMKLIHSRRTLVERLTSFHTFVCFNYDRDVSKAKFFFKKFWNASNEIHSLHELLKQQPEINWENCNNFMSLELRVVNDDYNRLIETEAKEERKVVLEQLENNPYVEKVHIYVANKMLAIYERISYLESVHPRMTARIDLKQLISFRKFLAFNNIKMFAKYILQKWGKKHGKFKNPIYKELFRMNLYKVNNDDNKETKRNDANENNDGDVSLSNNDDDVTMVNDDNNH